MKRGPTTRSTRFGLFRLENVGLPFRMTMAAAHDNGSKRFGAHLGCIVEHQTCPYLSFSFESLQVDGSGSTDLCKTYNRVYRARSRSLSAFPQMHDVSLQWRHDETRRKSWSVSTNDIYATNDITDSRSTYTRSLQRQSNFLPLHIKTPPPH